MAVAILLLLRNSEVDGPVGSPPRNHPRNDKGGFVMKKALVVFLALAFFGAYAFADNAPAPQGQFHAWNEGQFITAGSFQGGPAVH